MRDKHMPGLSREDISVIYAERENVRPGSCYGPVIRSVYILECCTGGVGSVIINGTEHPISAGCCYMLLPGDTNRVGYGAIPAEELRADLFKVGHHGQLDGADEALLDAVQPEAVVCCASSDRRYNSAHPDILRMITQRGGRLYFSDCPAVPDGVIGAAPHQALEFTVNPAGVLTAAYLAEV